MDHPESSRFPAPPGSRVVQAADAQQIGDAVGALWGRIAAALEPVVGLRGVAALFRHAVGRTTMQYPWLAGLTPADGEAADFTTMPALFAAQTPQLASEAGSALFDAFREVLVALVGPSLGDRLTPPLPQAAGGASGS